MTTDRESKAAARRAFLREQWPGVLERIGWPGPYTSTSLHDEFNRLAKLAKERGLYARSTYLGDIRRGLFSHARTMDFIDCAGVKLTVRESPQSGEKGA